MSKRYNNVAVLKGGPSAEREVSLRSGAAVAGGLREAGYVVSEIDVIDTTVDIPGGIEAVFIALHGEFGEDGGVQTLLEERGIPYVGAGPDASALAFDKKLSKERFVAAGVPTPEYEIVTRPDELTLDLPVVVKPLRQGSSIGVHIVAAEQEWQGACQDALRHDGEALVEDFVEGRELTVGIVGGNALPVVEIVAAGDWYDYESKYVDHSTEYLVPAPISDAVATQCRAVAMQTFDALGCRGFGRVDLRMTPAADLFVLELNSIPGFTETSLLPKAAQEAGMNFPTLCDRIMDLAALNSS
jgi:D-alanine-D-alanine ligase